MRIREFIITSSSGEISSVISYDADKYYSLCDCDDENLNNEKNLPILESGYWSNKIISEEPYIPDIL